MMTNYGKPVEIPEGISPWYLFGQVMNRIQEGWVDAYGRKRAHYGTIPEAHYVEHMYADIVWNINEERRKEANLKAEDDTIAHLSDDEILEAIEREKQIIDESKYMSLQMSKSAANRKTRDHFRRYHRVAATRGLEYKTELGHTIKGGKRV